MHKTCAETREYVAEFIRNGAVRTDVETVLCPPFTALATAQDALEGSGIGLGAQDIFWKTAGAYTGQVSPLMLTELGVTYAIIGHSERRGRFGVPEPDFDGAILRHFRDTGRSVDREDQAVPDAGITPISRGGE